MNPQITFKELFDSVRDTVGYKVEGLILEFTDQISEKLKTIGLSRTEFAKKIESSPAYVTKMLSGGTNFTLASMVKVADALDSEIRVQMVPKVSVALWMAEMEKIAPTVKCGCIVLSHWQRRNQADEVHPLVGFRSFDPDAEFDEIMAKQ